MLDRIAQTIVRYRMFESGQKVGVAVSGGADSVCLLHLLRELGPRWGLRLHVLHLNHRLRGAESDEDAAFVRRLAEELGLPFTGREADLVSASDNLEEAAREARLAFFGEMLASGQVDRVATGHTRSDQAETVLFRFLRGAGSAGLAGIRPVTSDGLVRPLLEVDRTDVAEFLRRQAISWRDDSSNLSLEFARNRIRHHLLPQLAREWNPALPQTLAQTADWALAEESYWEAEINRLEETCLIAESGHILLNVDNLNKLPVAAARRLVRRAMERLRGDLRRIDFSHVAAIVKLAATQEGHGRVQLPGLDILRSFEWLRLSRLPAENPGRPDYRLGVPIPGILRIPGTELEIYLELVEKKDRSEPWNSVYNGGIVGIDWCRLPGSLVMRNWRPGDQYQPRGSASAQKIKTLFQQFRVPLWERRYWPVLTDGVSVLWALRFGPAAEIAAGPESRTVLKIREMRIGREYASVYEGSGR